VSVPAESWRVVGDAPPERTGRCVSESSKRCGDTLAVLEASVAIAEPSQAVAAVNLRCGSFQCCRVCA
jgi:hypothetical protein